MELLIKLYNDKPSRIAVKYLYEYQAIKAYEDIIQKFKGEIFSLKIELHKTRVNLFLRSNDSGGQLVYRDLEFKTEQLKKLELHPVAGITFQFVHVFSRSNTLLVARPYRRSEFITLSGAEIFNPLHFDQNA